MVDEAAAIPAPLLLQLVSRFPRILLTTTVQGYEGTGTRFFYLSFAPVFRSFTALRFSQPVRWAPECPLENIVSEALIFDDEAFAQAPHGAIAISAFLPAGLGGDARVAEGCVSVTVGGALSYFAAGSAPNDGCARTAFLAGYGE